MRFITYNVLSSSLRSPASFPECEAAHLDPATRLCDVLDKIQVVMGKDLDVVFGLQEVSLAWVGEFRHFFEARDYTFAHSCYGTHFNGYMGVALAAPKTADLQRIESVVPPQLGAAGFRAWRAARDMEDARWYNKSARLLKDSLPFRPLLERLVPPNPVDPATLIASRQNRAIFATVECTRAHPTRPGKTLTDRVAVAVYHMPCLFRYPIVMAAHACLLNRSFHAYCTKVNIYDRVVLMDGNFQTGTAAYNLMRGVTSEAVRDALESVSPGIWDERVHRWMGGLRHIYPRTSPSCYTRGWTGDVFCGKIDYIWASPDLAGKMMPAESVAPVQYWNDQTKYLPNAEEPSDHYLLAVDLF